MSILNDITLLTCTFNNNTLTKCMIMSFFKQTGLFVPVVIMDNGTVESCTDDMRSVFTVIDNTNFKLTPDFKQVSRNHCASIDYVLRHCVKTKYAILCDNDILFKPKIKDLLAFLDRYDSIDAVGQIELSKRGYRLFPFFCIINVEKMKKMNVRYFDENNCMNNLETKYDNTGHWLSNKILSNTPCGLDTGGSFLTEIKQKKWDIKEIKINDYITHFASASWRPGVKNRIISWLKQNEELFI